MLYTKYYILYTIYYILYYYIILVLITFKKSAAAERVQIFGRARDKILKVNVKLEHLMLKFHIDYMINIIIIFLK